MNESENWIRLSDLRAFEKQFGEFEYYRAVRALDAGTAHSIRAGEVVIVTGEHLRSLSVRLRIEPLLVRPIEYIWRPEPHTTQ